MPSRFIIILGGFFLGYIVYSGIYGLTHQQMAVITCRTCPKPLIIGGGILKIYATISLLISLSILYFLPRVKFKIGKSYVSMSKSKKTFFLFIIPTLIGTIFFWLLNF